MGEVWAEFAHLMGDPAHWAFEIATDGIIGGVAILVGRIPFRRWVERHDKEHHGA